MKSAVLFGLVFFFMLPARAQDMPDNQLLYVAHRGASYLAPENTLASINLAWELGADAAECDVMLTADRKVVVFHDKNTKKLCGTGYDIKDATWEQLQTLKVKPRETNLPEYTDEGIPLLEDLLHTIPDDRTLVIEIKTGPEILPYLKQVVDRHWQNGNIAFISFNFESIRQAKAIYPEQECYYLSMFKADLNKHLDDIVKSELDGVNLRHGIIDQKIVDRCRERKLGIWCWTVNDPETAKKMQSLGVSALTTDRPAWLKEQMTK